ncbi:hypothetical protein BaRGS_00021310 [Batillaria attramentaria]|uniref:Uncharacterized protein n=1 Tax=Batillaria attramentaria TaxID=370345 RepID=A0ABD0KJY5_9CAEN
MSRKEHQTHRDHRHQGGSEHQTHQRSHVNPEQQMHWLKSSMSPQDITRTRKIGKSALNTSTDPEMRGRPRILEYANPQASRNYLETSLSPGSNPRELG